MLCAACNVLRSSIVLPPTDSMGIVRPCQLSSVLHYRLFCENLYRATESANHGHDLKEMEICSLDLPGLAVMSTPFLRIYQRFRMQANHGRVFLQSSGQSRWPPTYQVSQ